MNSSKQRVLLITGGAGFVGSHCALFFKSRYPHWRVVALDNLKRRGSELNLPRLKEAGIEFIHGDIRVRSDLASVGLFDLLIEASAEPSVQAGFTGGPDYVVQTNLSGTFECLEAARSNKADVIFLSTSRVYPISTIRSLPLKEVSSRFVIDRSVPGCSEKGISEALALRGPRSLYGATKLASELLLEEYGFMYGLRYVINRCGVIAGPWQMGKVDQGFLVHWIARHLYGGKLSYSGFGGQGKQVRDVLHILDLCELLDLQIHSLSQIDTQVFNVGGGMYSNTSLCELTDLVSSLCGKRIDIGSDLETKPADIPYYVSDIGKIESALGWKPQREMKVIVEDVFAWMRSNEDVLRPILQ